ncbi:MAG: glycosyltransferase family 87 protein [Silvibacterium sp.]
MSTAASRKKARAGKKKYSPVFLGVFAVFLIVTVFALGHAIVFILEARLGHHDTRWFWASGQLLAHRANPYDETAVGRLQAALGIPVDTNNIVRNPPSALFLTLPLGLLEPWQAVVMWSLLLAVCFALSIQTMRSILGERYRRGYLWLAWCFAPAICCIEVGQTGVVLLLGLTLFLRFHERRPFWAGMALSLCAFKPHIFLPFGAVLLVWIAARKKWWIPTGAVVALAVESGIAMMFDRAVWAHYRTAMQTQHIADQFIPTLGVALRFLVDGDALWLQFVPAAFGCAWALWYFFRNRERWDWQMQGSLVTLVSLVAAPYSWFTDQAVALPAILFALLGAQKPRRGSLTLLLVLMTLATLERLSTETLFFLPFMLQCVAWLLWYLYATWKPAHAEDAVVAG